jgi:urease accessory protein UreF
MARLHLEWYTTAPGVTWLPQWVEAHLTAAVRAVVIDERGALTELDWPGVKVRPTVVGHREVAVAAGLLWDAITEGALVHRGQVELTRAVLAAKTTPDARRASVRLGPTLCAVAAAGCRATAVRAPGENGNMKLAS